MCRHCARKKIVAASQHLRRFFTLNALLHILGNGAIELVEFGAFGALPEQNPALEPPRQNREDLVAHVRPGGDGKDIIEFLERTLLGLGNPKENHNQSTHVKACVEAESAGGAKDLQDAREGDGKDSGPEQAGGDGPGHADFAVGKGEDFGGIGEWDGAFAGRVECCEQEDEEGDQA